MNTDSIPTTIPAVGAHQGFPLRAGEKIAGHTITGIADGDAGQRATLQLADGSELVYRLDLTDRRWQLTSTKWK